MGGEQDHHQQGGLEIETNKAVDMREDQHQHAGKPDEIKEVSVSEDSKESSLLEEHEHHQPVGLRVATNNAVGMGEEQHQHAGDCDEIEESSVS